MIDDTRLWGDVLVAQHRGIGKEWREYAAANGAVLAGLVAGAAMIEGGRTRSGATVALLSGGLGFVTLGPPALAAVLGAGSIAWWIGRRALR